MTSEAQLIHDLGGIVEVLTSEPEFSHYRVADHTETRCELQDEGAILLVLAPEAWKDDHTLQADLARYAVPPVLLLLGNENDFHHLPDIACRHILCIALPTSRTRLCVNLRGLTRLASRDAAAEQDHFWADRYKYELDELMGIARAISNERDIDTLLYLILEKARYITGADAGSVYVVEEKHADNDDGSPHGKPGYLRFKVTQNESLELDFTEFTMPISKASIVGNAVLRKESINIPDLYRLDPDNQWGVTHDRTFDQKIGYESHSMLTVPMVNQREEVIGVIQLINKKQSPKVRLTDSDSFSREVVPFDERSESLAVALASQAGIALENALLYDEVQRLFEGFVRAAVVAIESRDPTTSGHSQRVSDLTVGLAKAIDRVGEGPFKGTNFNRDQVKEIEYASLLHDFGKVGVREEVLVKAKKLYAPNRDLVLQRFEYIRRTKQAEILQRKLALLQGGPVAIGGNLDALLAELDAEEQRLIGNIDDIEEFLLKINEPTVLESSGFERLDEIAHLTYTDWKGETQPMLTHREIVSLKIPRGSLTDDERKQIESHVSHTYQFLRTIPWTRVLRDVPRIAWMHHEKLNGGGYPRGVSAPEIPIQTRMMTISDIFDALTARDRPYKRAVPVDKALKILGWEVDEGKLDPELYKVFIDADIYKLVL